MVILNENLGLLEDLRARVIFYSCLARPMNVLEISKLWDYKTSTYFYQNQSKKVISELISKNIIETVEGSCYKANYDLILEKKGLEAFFNKINNGISNQILIEKYNYEITEGQLEDPLFKEFCIEKKSELKGILSDVEINPNEIDSFNLIWKQPIFKKIFLSADLIKKIVGDRWGLPKDPREFLFEITMNFLEKIYEYKENRLDDSPFHTDSWFMIDEIMPMLYSLFKDTQERYSTNSAFLYKSIIDIYQIMNKKFSTYQGKNVISAFHVSKITEIIGI